MEDLLRLAKAGELKGFCFGAITRMAAKPFADFYGRNAAKIWNCSGLEHICTSTSSAPPVSHLPARSVDPPNVPQMAFLNESQSDNAALADFVD